MSTQVAPISQELLKKWGVAIQEFANEIFKKYPSLDGGFIPILVEELRALGLAKEYISTRSLWAAFRNCVGDNRIVLPPVEPTLTPEALEKLRAKFPTVIKTVERQLTQREKNALSGVERQSARRSHSQPEESSPTGMSGAMNAINLTKLKAEYRTRLAEAESAVGNSPRNHAETFRLRKSMKAALAADKRFDSVRES